MISAGADICAVDKYGLSVSDVAIESGQLALWIEALKYCGIDIKDVLARPNSNPAHSTALDSKYNQPHRSVTSKVSLEKYMERRKAFRVPEEKEVWGMEAQLDSSEDDDSEHGEIEVEDFAGDTRKVSEMIETEYEDEDHEFPMQHGAGTANGKAKLD